MEGRVVKRRRQLERFLLPRLDGQTWSHSLGEQTTFDGHSIGMAYETGLLIEIRVKHLRTRATAEIEFYEPGCRLRYYGDIVLSSRRDLVRLCRLVDRVRAFAETRQWQGSPISDAADEQLEPASDEAHEVYRAVLEALYPESPPVYHRIRSQVLDWPELWYDVRARRLDLDREAFLAWAAAPNQRLVGKGPEVLDHFPTPFDFYARFPRAPGLVTFSPVGFDSHLQRACVWLEHDTLLKGFERGPMTDKAGRYRSVRRLLALTRHDDWRLDGWIEGHPGENEWKEFERARLAALLPKHVVLKRLEYHEERPGSALLEATWKGTTRQVLVVDRWALPRLLSGYPSVLVPGMPTVITYPLSPEVIVEGIQALLDEA
ncbi:MAG: hypothetical protein AB7S38_37260 [Vulcanimicrobiota bacterium]